MSSERPLILAVDTATVCSSVALTVGDVHDGELVAEMRLNAKVTHSRRLLSGIDWLLDGNELRLEDIDGLTVGLGPGSFTGLRIGMATMKGLAAAMEKPLIGVSTLDGVALCCSGEKPLCVLLDARKKELYRRWYHLDEAGVYRGKGPIQALTPQELIGEVKEETLMAGDGLAGYGDLLQESLGELISMAPLLLRYPSAAALGFLGGEKLNRGEILDVESAAPMYVRASDAELSLLRKEEQGHKRKS